MPTLSTPPDAARLAFTLELTGWKSYPVDAHGQFMTGRSPEERAAALFRAAIADSGFAGPLTLLLEDALWVGQMLRG